MEKYLLLWELDQTRVPVDPRERGSLWDLLVDNIQRELDKGNLKDWGVFTGSHTGYFIFEGSKLEVSIFIQQYVPYVLFKSHHVSSTEVIKNLNKALIG